jgi:hypothetical protein
LYASQYGLFSNKDEARDNLDRYVQLIISPENLERQEYLKKLYDSEKIKPLGSKVDELMEVFDLIKIFKDEKGELFPEGIMRNYIKKADPALIPIFELIFQKAYGKEYKTTEGQ